MRQSETTPSTNFTQRESYFKSEELAIELSALIFADEENGYYQLLIKLLLTKTNLTYSAY